MQLSAHMFRDIYLHDCGNNKALSVCILILRDGVVRAGEYFGRWTNVAYRMGLRRVFQMRDCHSYQHE